jgi:hypothetical protein
MNGAGVEERAGWGSESPCCAILGGGEGGLGRCCRGKGARGEGMVFGHRWRGSLCIQFRLSCICIVTCLDRCCDLELVPYGLLMMVETPTLVGVRGLYMGIGKVLEKGIGI